MNRTFTFKNYSTSTFILFGIFCGTIINSFIHSDDSQSHLIWLIASLGVGVAMNLSATEDRILFKLDNK